jgi:hypothetical protein
MARKTDKYAAFVEHPRYGRAPHITGLNPILWEDGVHLHWHTLDSNEVPRLLELVSGNNSEWRRPQRIANTAIVADVDKQTPSPVPVTHYFDLARNCRACGRPFIFFAREQKYWYEALGFSLNSDCVHCVECRKQQQGVARQRETYESLFHIAEKTTEQLIVMADACLSLIEAGEFTKKQTQRARALLNAVPEEADVRKRSRFADLMKRVTAIESQGEQT